jgi:hypothetical protein
MAKAQTTPNFGALLDTPSSEVERPKPLPAGSYTAVVHGLPRYDKSTKKQTEFVEFTLNLLAAGDDVDEGELKEMGGFAGKTMRATYYITDTALWRLKDFLDHLGIEDEGSLRQRIEEAPGKQVGIFIKHEPSQDGTTFFAQIGKTFVVE